MEKESKKYDCERFLQYTGFKKKAVHYLYGQQMENVFFLYFFSLFHMKNVLLVSEVRVVLKIKNKKRNHKGVCKIF